MWLVGLILSRAARGTVLIYLLHSVSVHEGIGSLWFNKDLLFVSRGCLGTSTGHSWAWMKLTD